MNDETVPASPAIQPPPPHNPIFAKFVDGSGDPLLGYVAYGIYKSRKREWAAEHAKRTGNPPAASELAAYHATWTDGLIESTRQIAEASLGAYADVVVAEETPEILKEALRGSFWRDVGVSIFAAFIFTLILILLAVILAISGIDLLAILSALRGN